MTLMETPVPGTRASVRRCDPNHVQFWGSWLRAPSCLTQYTFTMLSRGRGFFSFGRTPRRFAVSETLSWMIIGPRHCDRVNTAKQATGDLRRAGFGVLSVSACTKDVFQNALRTTD